MAVAYSEDLRVRVMRWIDEGQKVKGVAKLFQIGRTTLYRWIGQRKSGGSLKPKENWQHGHSHKITDLEAFKKFAEENQGLTAIEMAEKWGNITPKTIRLTLHRIGFTRKKRPMAIESAAKKNAQYIWTR